MNHRTLMWTGFAAVTVATGFFLSMIPFAGPIFMFYLFGRVHKSSPVACQGSRVGWLILISGVVISFSALWNPGDTPKYDWTLFAVYISFCCVVGAIVFLFASNQRKSREEMMPNVFRSNRRVAVRVAPQRLDDRALLKKVLIADKATDRQIYRQEHPRQLSAMVSAGVEYVKNNRGESAMYLLLAVLIVFVAYTGFLRATSFIPPAKERVQNEQGRITTACAKDAEQTSTACQYQDILKLIERQNQK